VELRERLLDAALELAAEQDWESVRLAAVAARAGVGLAELAACFREKEDIAEAWFDRADRAMLARVTAPDFDGLGPGERLGELILAWIAALAPHRRTTRAMLLNKLEPGHLHVQVPALLRISRTVQWFREAADRRVAGRPLDEAALTLVYLGVFTRWLAGSGDLEDTRAFLGRQLRRAGFLD